MPFSNRIRLSFELKKAQFPEERTSFRKANGVTQTLSVVIRKTYEGNTDFWPEAWHQRFKVALAHDNITVEGDRYLGDIAQDGDYAINWPDFLDYPTAPAAFKVEVTPFDATNSNCQTCEEASQLTLEDDTMPSTLAEDTDYTINVATNDTICCYPAVFSLTSYNSTYLTSASINATTGLVSFHTGTGLTDVNGLLIATYRVTCPNGGYDEASIYANIDGSVAGCLAPTNLAAAENPTAIHFTWVEPFNDADYEYELYEGTSPIGTPVQTGLISIFEFVTLTGLDPDTAYYFQVRTVCASSNSIWVGIQANTTPESDTCGEYEVAYNNGSGIPSESLTVQYRDCNLAIQYVLVYNNSSVIICAGQTSPGSPVAISGGSAGAGSMTTNYLGLC